MLLISSGSIFLLWSDILILGLMGSALDVGIYSAASRVVGATSLVIVAINSITSPKYAKFNQESEISEIKKLANNSFKITFFIGIIFMLILVLFSESILSLFGHEFIIGKNILIILSIGQAFNISLGSVAFLLTMTGNEKIMQKIMLSSAIINILLSILLFQLLGAVGIALSTTISIAIWKIWALLVVKKKLGFWVIKF